MVLSWRKEASFATLSRAGHSTCAWNGRLLLFGGRTGAAFYSDVWAYDAAARTWELWCECWPHTQRSYHSTTLVGGEVWLCGGSSTDTVVGDVLVFNPATRAWRSPALRGDLSLLRRTAHGACLHPARPHCILLQGGYGTGPEAAADSQDYSYLSDLAELNTRTGVVRALHPAGTPPAARAYHAFAALGACCYVLAGRTASNRLVKGKQVVVLYDAAADRWVTPGVIGGELTPRSSHRAVAAPGGILLFGGAVDIATKGADLHLLTAGAGSGFGGGGRLCWHQLGPPGGGGTAGDTAGGTAAGWPAGRGAHAAEALEGRLYVLGGYGEERQYTGDCWSISLEVAGSGDAAPPVMAPAPRDNPAKQSGGSQLLPEVSEWREARRSRPAAAFAASEPQAGTKRQRLVAAGTRHSPRTAKAAPAGEAAQARGPPAELACAVAAAAAATDFGSAGKRVQRAQAVCQQQQLQPPRVVDQAGQGQLPQSPAHAAAPTHPQQRLAELQTALQQQQVAAAAREQLVADLQRANSQLQAQCVQWEGMARDRQASELGVQAAAQQHSVQVAELQRQLAAAQRERDDARRATAVAAQTEHELLDLRSQQRRERDARERDELERDRYIDTLKRDLVEMRQNLAAATESNATQAKLLDSAREDLTREQRAVSEARKTHAEERERFTRTLQEQQDLLAAAQQSRETAQALLEAEQRAYKEARAEVERQNAQAQLQAERAKRAEDSRDQLQGKVDEQRADLQRLQAAEERWRASKAAVQSALGVLQKGVEGMP